MSREVRSFTVKMHRTVTFYAEIEVEAKDEREARRMAREKAEERGTWSDAEYCEAKIDSVTPA